MKFTKEQQNALEANGRVLVSAAAGSGKTAVLVERVARRLIDENNPVPADRILVATFTNAAASEMKTRISKRLAEELKKSPNSFWLKKQKLLLTKAKICTIDSLCISLTKEYFYKLDLPVDFKTADNATVSKLSEKCLEETIADYFERSPNELSTLLSIIGGENADKELKKQILKINGYLDTLPFPNQYIEKINSLYSDFDENSIWLNIIFSNALENIEEQLSLFTTSYQKLKSDELYTAYGEAFEYILSFLQRLKELITNHNYNNIYKNLNLFIKPRLNGIRGYSDDTFKEKMKNAKDSAVDCILSLKKIFCCSFEEAKSDIDILGNNIKLLLDITASYNDRLYNEKINNNCLSFSDTEIAALKLLAEFKDGEIQYTDIAKELSERYCCVMVDEYQDTNDLQNTIFNALSDNGNKLFMVGDVKQSIYGFRKANPKNFLNCRNLLPEFNGKNGGGKVIMAGNFRSCKEICQAVNIVFSGLMSEKCGDMRYTQADKLIPLADFIDIDEKKVDFHIIDTDKEDIKDEAEAIHIANYILNKINGKPCITKDKKLCVPNFSDFAILLRSRSSIPTFSEIFKQMGIPFWADNSSGLFGSKEITTIISMLNVINNPFYDIALLSLMMSDIYLFSADEIATLRINNKKSSLYTALMTSNNLTEKQRTFINEIEYFRSIATTSSVYKLLTEIYNKTSYINTVYLYDNRKQAHSNLILFKNIAKDYEETTGRGLNYFIRYINHRVESGEDTDMSSIIGENDNAVKIMTMHRSKGLQFPICIVASLHKKFNKRDNYENLITGEQCGIGLKMLDSERKIRFATLPHKAIAIENLKNQMSEEMRLLYVAMTRAKDFLLLSGCINDAHNTIDSFSEGITLLNDNLINPAFVLKSDNFLKWLIASGVAFENGLKPEFFSKEEPIEKEVDDKKTDYNYDESIVKQLNNILSFEYPYKTVNSVAAKQSASAIAHRSLSDNFAFSSVPLFLQKQKLNAAQKGTAMHLFMQLCNFETSKNNIETEINRILKEGKMSETEANSLNKDSLNEFFNSEICKRAIDSNNIFKEKDFMVELPALEVDNNLGKEFDSEKIVIQGFVDLCFIENERLIIVDYKTDHVKEECELVSSYSKQLDIYSKALRQVFEINNVESYIYSFKLNKTIKL